MRARRAGDGALKRPLIIVCNADPSTVDEPEVTHVVSADTTVADTIRSYNRPFSSVDGQWLCVTHDDTWCTSKAVFDWQLITLSVSVKITSFLTSNLMMNIWYKHKINCISLSFRNLYHWSTDSLWLAISLGHHVMCRRLIRIVIFFNIVCDFIVFLLLYQQE